MLQDHKVNSHSPRHPTAARGGWTVTAWNLLQFCMQTSSGQKWTVTRRGAPRRAAASLNYWLFLVIFRVVFEVVISEEKAATAAAPQGERRRASTNNAKNEWLMAFWSLGRLYLRWGRLQTIRGRHFGREPAERELVWASFSFIFILDYPLYFLEEEHLEKLGDWLEILLIPLVTPIHVLYMLLQAFMG